MHLLQQYTGSQHDDKKTRVLMELECSPIKMDLESRPRTNALKFEVSVGGLYLRDKATKDSIIPVLVSPQMKDKSQSRQPLVGLFGGAHIVSRSAHSLPTLFGTRPIVSQEDHTLFECVFERNPQQSQADYRYTERRAYTTYFVSRVQFMQLNVDT